MGGRETFDRIGKVVAIIAGVIIFFQLLLVWSMECNPGRMSDFGNCVITLVMVAIPTEVAIIEILQAVPFILFIVLGSYLKLVSPHLNKDSV